MGVVSMYVFNFSNIGFRHINGRTVLQDYSASYIDNERTIITCADGHGGKMYIRSNLGSKFASEATINVLKRINKEAISKKKREITATSIRLSILCEWNSLVEQHLNNHKIRKKEIANLDDCQKFELSKRPRSAYGTTLTGAMAIGDKLIVVSIGDSECLGIKKGEIVTIFNNDDEPVGNVTYSMCQEDAFNHLKVSIMNIKELDGVLLCTDGLSTPYQSYDNLNESFIKPTVSRLKLDNDYSKIRKKIKSIAEKEGTGDDVTLSFMLFDHLKVKYYRRN